MQTITIRRQGQEPHTFQNVPAAVAYVEEHWDQTCTLYCSAAVFEEIYRAIEEPMKQRAQEDIAIARRWKAQAHTWNDMEDCNDMIDTVQERMHERSQELKQRLKFGGETDQAN